MKLKLLLFVICLVCLVTLAKLVPHLWLKVPNVLVYQAGIAVPGRIYKSYAGILLLEVTQQGAGYNNYYLVAPSSKEYVVGNGSDYYISGPIAICKYAGASFISLGKAEITPRLVFGLRSVELMGRNNIIVKAFW